MMHFPCDLCLKPRIELMVDFFMRSSIDSKRIFLFPFGMVEEVCEFRIVNLYVIPYIST